MKCILRVRYLVFLALLYLILVLLLYYYLWQDRALSKLLETPAGFEGTFTNDLDYDYPVEDPHVAEDDPGGVEFNFRRNSAPQGVKIFNGPQKRPSNTSLGGYGTQVTMSKTNTTNDITKTTSKPESLQLNRLPLKNLTLPKPNPCLHAFYYAWYGNVQTDGRYKHWNHRYLPHWKDSVTSKYPQGRHVPPDDVGASFYPELGCYSSRDPAVVATHMTQLRVAGVGVIVVSWYPAGLADEEGPPPDPVIPVLLDAALAHDIKLTLHIEPYKGRTPQSVRGDLQYIHSHYSQHPAFYKLERLDPNDGAMLHLPLMYIYDSYLSEAREWASVFKRGGPLSIRGTNEDCVAIALLVEHAHMRSAVDGGFDGVYTYFAAEGFSFGSTYTNWGTVSEFAAEKNLIFIPSFGPGYDDLQVRPWNRLTARDRKNGAYYKEGFRRAKRSSRGGLVSITSFNEWGEGTQIEPAVPKISSSRTYLDYSPGRPDFYLLLTRDMAEELPTDCGIT